MSDDRSKQDARQNHRGLVMKKLLVFLLTAVLIIQAGGFTVFAKTGEEEQTITISNIEASLTGNEAAASQIVIRAEGLPTDSITVVGGEWSWPEELVISGENIDVQGGKYSYKLVLRANGTLTFDNDLQVFYQGINGKYKLNYEIDETDNHIMIVSGTFENIIVGSPLMEKLSEEYRNWILSHISGDSYDYQLNLRTREGFTFTNALKFLLDSKPFGYTINYAYDLLTGKQSVEVGGITDSAPAKLTSNLITVKSPQTVSLKRSNKVDQKFRISASAKDRAAVSYALKTAPKKIRKYLTVSSGGKVTVKKKCPKGTYKIKVAVTAAKTKNYKKTTADKTIKLVIK